MRYSKKRTYLWSANMAYLVGLMASDGCLSSDGRHLDMTSVDTEQLTNFLTCLGREVTICKKRNQHKQTAYRVQFSDVALYDFLFNIGITPNKSKTIGELKVPEKYYADFLRGIFDGDGSVSAFWDKRWRSSYMYYVSYSSASRDFLEYLQVINHKLCKTSKGSLRFSTRVYTLRYAKKDSKLLYKFMYHSKDLVSLSRKKLKMESFLKTDNLAKI